MNGIFVDTSGWGNLVDALQPFHAETKAIYSSAKQNGARLVTTNYIIAELLALLSSPLRIPRKQSIKLIEGIKSSGLVDIVHVNEDLDAKSWDLLKNRADKNWSLVDCSSFVVMQENKIVEALTTDHHFEQAGFVRLQILKVQNKMNYRDYSTIDLNKRGGKPRARGLRNVVYEFPDYLAFEMTEQKCSKIFPI